MNKGTIIVCAVLAVIFSAAAVTSVVMLNGSHESSRAFIYSNGVLVREVDLLNIDEPLVFRVDTEDGGYNIIEAEYGKIHVKEASCPDKVCINTGYISDGVLPVSCLPNKLVIRIESEKNDEGPDIVVN